MAALKATKASLLFVVSVFIGSALLALPAQATGLLQSVTVIASVPLASICFTSDGS